MIDSTNIEALKEFFKGHEYHTNFELAKLMNVHACTIRRWRKKCGIDPLFPPKVGFVKSYKSPQKKKPKITNPKVWDNREWFEEYYYNKGYGIIALSEIIQKPVVLIYRRFKKYNIKSKKHGEVTASDHPYCSYEWLKEHYLDKKMTIGQCAYEAKVNRYTIYNWLTKFNIETRDKYEVLAGDKPRIKIRYGVNNNGREYVRWRPPSGNPTVDPQTNSSA